MRTELSKLILKYLEDTRTYFHRNNIYNVLDVVSERTADSILAQLDTLELVSRELKGQSHQERILPEPGHTHIPDDEE